MPLVPSPAKVLAQTITEDEIGGWVDADPAPEWNVTSPELPEDESPDKYIAVKDTGGLIDSRQMRGPVSDYYSVQLLIRADTDDNAQAKIKQICDQLDSLYARNVTVDGVGYTINHVRRQGEPAFLRQMERYKMRDYVINCRIRFR